MGACIPAHLSEPHIQFHTKSEVFFSRRLDYHQQQLCVTTKKSQRWSWTMDPECARPVLPAMTLHVQSSLPSLADPDTSVSWSVWVKKMPTSVMRLSQREVRQSQTCRRHGRYGSKICLRR